MYILSKCTQCRRVFLHTFFIFFSCRIYQLFHFRTLADKAQSKQQTRELGVLELNNLSISAKIVSLTYTHQCQHQPGERYPVSLIILAFHKATPEPSSCIIGQSSSLSRFQILGLVLFLKFSRVSSCPRKQCSSSYRNQTL